MVKETRKKAFVLLLLLTAIDDIGVVVVVVVVTSAVPVVVANLLVAIHCWRLLLLPGQEGTGTVCLTTSTAVVVVRC